MTENAGERQTIEMADYYCDSCGYTWASNARSACPRCSGTRVVCTGKTVRR